jgi:hypothetical protein
VFTASRLGGVVAGVALALLAGPVGAKDLVWVAVALAALGAFITRPGVEHAPSAEEDRDADEEGPVARVLKTWRTAWASPLVRAIALSTACMVFVRYGLKLLALDAVEEHFGGQEDQVAAFLGFYATWANVAAIGLGVLVTPHVVARLGAGAANAAYAVLVLGAYGLLGLAPSLGAAVAARFVDVELKDALKTPLSALFYGAERPDDRAPARAFVFGAVIPVATVITALALRALEHGWLVSAGLAVAAVFVVASLAQNRAWRRRHVELLAWKVGDVAAADAPEVPAEIAALPPGRRRDAARLAFAALASTDPRVRALAAEVLGEQLPRGVARRIVGA